MPQRALPWRTHGSDLRAACTELRERLGDAASDSLVDMLREVGAEQRDDVFTMVEERFALRLAETRDELRSEMHAGFLNLQEQIGSVRAEIGGVRAELHVRVTPFVALRQPRK